MNYAVLLAGGIGTRMKAHSIPKQFLEIGGEPILRLTVDKFLACYYINHIIVAAPTAWMSHTFDILREERFSNVFICEGGSTRQESLYKAIKFIETKFKTSDDDIIISHDVARPFVSLRVIEENIKEIQNFDAVDTVIHSTDTIVESKDNKLVYKIPNRKNMFQGQTPQTFKRKKYLEIYESLDKEYLENVTDAAKILVEHGCSVGLVQGDEFNIKITTEYDLRIANFLLEANYD